ncbi:isoprenoid synthase domain-containing protein [Mycena belliarum]|uniref:Terpene synthase n=1 Tax=Mycena belliarum TaxID=1033014 RepID=A0AAD6U1P0_9AGAR|nr:isoprenoid synthase domain-containing protein [Mycena belliae]
MSIEFHVPDLLDLVADYVKPLNPSFAELDAGFQTWVDAAAFLSAPHKKAWKHAELPLLIARAFPEADAAHLRVCLDSMMMFLILEQLTDTPATSATSKKWAAEFVEALQTAASEEPQAKKEGPAAVLQHLGTKVIKAMDPAYRPAYIGSNVLLAEGVVQEALDREQHDGADPISLATYLNTRRKSIGALPFHDLARWIWNLDLPEHVLQNPHIKHMVEASVDMVALGNDIYSYRKEYLEDGAKHNYVTVAMHDPSTSFRPGDVQAAIDYTVQQFSAALARFKENKKLLPLFDDDADLARKVDRYAELMMDSVAGNIEWSIACKRYSLFPDEAARKKGLITITVN